MNTVFSHGLKLGALVLTSAVSLSVAASSDHAGHAGHAATSGTAPTQAQASAPGQATAADMAEGEVRRLDKDGGRVTLKHGEIKSLDMPPMTMVFGVRERAMLDKVKVGDKIRFRVVNEAGKLTLTDLVIVQ